MQGGRWVLTPRGKVQPKPSGNQVLASMCPLNCEVISDARKTCILIPKPLLSTHEPSFEGIK
eukprot:5264333-Amphidinium_carterae.1